eukprot:g775.t1
MQYRREESSRLRDLHPHVVPAEKPLKRVPVAYGRAGITNLIDILEEDISEEALANALGQIRNHITCQEVKMCAIEHGLVEVCGRGLRRDWAISEYIDEKQAKVLISIRRKTFDIVGEISTLSQGRRALRKEKMQDVLLASLTEKYIDVSASAIKALSKWLCFREGAKTFLKTDVKPKDMIPCLNSDNLSVVIAVHDVFSCLTASARGVKLALGCKIMKYVAQNLNTASKNAAFKGEDNENEDFLGALLRTTCNMAHDEVGNERVVVENTPKILCSRTIPFLLELKSDHLNRLASGALKAIAVSKEGKKRISVYGIDVVTKFAASEDAFTASNAAICIRGTSKLPDAKKKFVEALLSNATLMHSVYGVTAMQELVPHLLSGPLSAQRDAIVVVNKLVMSKEGQEMSCQCVRLVEAMATLLFSSDARTASLSGRALALLTKANHITCKQIAKLVVQRGGFENGSTDDDEFGRRLKRALAAHAGMSNRVLRHVGLFKRK